MRGDCRNSEAMTDPWRRRVELAQGRAVLYEGSCFDVLPAIGPVDHIITDPPYSERTHTGARANRPGVTGGARLIDFPSWTAQQFGTFARACLDITQRWTVMTCDMGHAATLIDWPELVRLGVWVKGAPMPQISGDRPGQGHEMIACLHGPGRKRWNGGGKPAVWKATVIKDPSSAKIASQKPVALLNALVNDFTDVDELICDPCMGAGTSGSAAIGQGRRFLGIELDPDHFDIACERIDQASRQGRLFA